MTRKVGWEVALTEYLESRENTQFIWGHHDCCTFACGALEVQGLSNPMRDVEPYDTRDGAVRALVRLGGSLDAAANRLASAVGLTEVAVGFAGRGCVVIADILSESSQTIEPHLGVVGTNGRHALFPGGKGLVRVPLNSCRRAWRSD